jgi:hypothetical protein
VLKANSYSDPLSVNPYPEEKEGNGILAITIPTAQILVHVITGAALTVTK